MQLPELTKLYYAIGEVAEMFDVAPSVIRYWETEFTQIKPAKNSKGERKFTVKDINTLQEIYHLVKEKGFTIEGARRELTEMKTDRKEHENLLKQLKSLRNKIVDLRDQL